MGHSSFFEEAWELDFAHVSEVNAAGIKTSHICPKHFRGPGP